LKNIFKDFQATSPLLAKYHVLLENCLLAAKLLHIKVELCFHDLKEPNRATIISENNGQKKCPPNGVLQLKPKSRKANKASIASECII